MPPILFEHRSTIKATPEAMLKWHEHPKAFQRLTPPPVFIHIHRKDLKSLREGQVEFTMWFGPVPVRWVAVHEPGPIPTSFIDRQIKGPLAFWEHHHIFQPVDKGVELIDRITLTHPTGWKGFLTRLMFGQVPLRLLFIYRHWRTRWGVKKVR